MEDEATIRAAVEQRQQRAWDIGIVGTVFNLYRYRIQYLGKKAEYDLERLPEGITDTRPIAVIGNEENIILRFPNKTFRFLWEPRTNYLGDDTEFAELFLFDCSKVVLSLSCIRDPSKFLQGEWGVSSYMSVDSFIEGAWIQEISDFAAQIESIDMRIQADMADELKQWELQELKKRFGL